jgi:hypothetical protein
MESIMKLKVTIENETGGELDRKIFTLRDGAGLEDRMKEAVRRCVDAWTLAIGDQIKIELAD